MMKNLVFFICSLLLLGACSSGKVELPKEVKLNLSVSKDSVKIGETVTVTCLAENAERTSNNIGAPTGISWSFPLVINGKITISVVAYGSGKSISQDKIVNVLPVIVPTMKDSLAAHGWKLTKREDWKISTNTIVSNYELSAVQLSDVIFFGLDGYSRIYHAGETTSYAGGKFIIVGRTLTSDSSDQVIKITLLTDSTLQLDQVDKYTPDLVIKSFYKAAP